MEHILAKDLKNSIIKAAVCGNLTETISSDSDVETEFAEIIEERNDLIAKKIIKKEKINECEFDNEVPKNWKCVKLGTIIKLLSGQDLESNRYSDKKIGIPYLTGASNFNNGELIINRFTNSPTSIAEYGDLLLTCKGTVGEMAYLKEPKAHIARQIMAIKPLKKVNIEYIKLCLDDLIAELNKKAHSLIPGIDRDIVLNSEILLPSSEEQQRIVYKVDELMAKIDEYEKIENQLVQLKKEFPGDMRDAILQAAFSGQLTEQLKDDSDAFALAEKIKEKRNLKGKNKYVTDSEFDIVVPENWAIIKSGECFSLDKAEKVSNVKLPYLEAKYLRGKTIPTIMTEGEFVKKGTKVILVDGENSGEIFIEPEDGIIGSTFKVLYMPEEINERYALYFLEKNKELYRNNKKGAAIPHLSKELFNDLSLPIPPIEEQQRIVDLLDKVLPLCDTLE